MFTTITSIIKRYIKKSGTDYAILMNGGWGCGKTYYVEHELMPALKEEGFRPIYISLNGLKTNAEVSLRIVASCVARNKDKLASIMTSSLSYDAFSAMGDHWWTKAILELSRMVSKRWNVSFDVSAKTDVLIVDDVERVSNQADLLSLIGWMHEVYIKNGFHVVFIADEKHISKNSNYEECKEKYIRQSVDFSELSKERLEAFAKGYYKECSWLYAAIQDRYLEFVGKKKIVNLRIVSMILDAVREVCEVLDEEVRKHADFVFMCIAPLMHAQANGYITANDKDGYAGLTNLDRVRFFLRTREKRDKISEDEKKTCLFFDEYDEVFEGSHYILVKSLFRYVVTGLLSSHEIRNEIESLLIRKERPEQKAYSRLQEYWCWEEDELLAIVKDVMEYLNQGLYSLGEILQIYSYFITIKNEVYLSSWPYNTSLEEAFCGFVNDCLGKMTITQEVLDNLRHRSKGYVGERNEKKSLYQVIEKFYNRQIANRDNERISNFFNALRNRNQSDAARYARDEHDSWALFIEIDRAGLIDEIIKLPSWGLLYLGSEAREHILTISNSGDFEFEQLIPIGRIVDRLKEYSKQTDLTASRKARVEDLIQDLERSRKHIVNSMSFPARRALVKKYGEVEIRKVFKELGVDLEEMQDFS